MSRGCFFNILLRYNTDPGYSINYDLTKMWESRDYSRLVGMEVLPQFITLLVTRMNSQVPSDCASMRRRVSRISKGGVEFTLKRAFVKQWKKQNLSLKMELRQLGS